MREKSVRNTALSYQPDTKRAYEASPAAETHRTGQWVELWLPDTSGDAYGIVPDLKADGIVHYVSAPALMASGMKKSFCFATVARHPGASETPFEVGIALRLREVAYGNVGSGALLDYTVIGRDVNLASRIASLCGTLDEALLLSQPVRDTLGGLTLESRGYHELKAPTEPQEIFVPESLPRTRAVISRTWSRSPVDQRR